MRKKFVFATNNSHKLEEVTAILGEKVETSQHEGYQMRY
mgnify:CR=1 FL=1